jgi:hypothetical protein
MQTEGLMSPKGKGEEGRERKHKKACREAEQLGVYCGPTSAACPSNCGSIRRESSNRRTSVLLQLGENSSIDADTAEEGRDRAR